jgi:hypothetical protein
VECRHFIALLRRVIGPEPAGARLRVRRSEEDFDPYLDVIVEYDGADAVARAYAIRCDREAPTRWPSPAAGAAARVTLAALLALGLLTAPAVAPAQPAAQAVRLLRADQVIEAGSAERRCAELTRLG